MKVLRCFAEKRDRVWEAICLDLDIAVQADSLDEVMTSMRIAIELYLETVAELPIEQREGLLERPAPLSVRLRFLFAVARSTLLKAAARPLPFAVPAAV